MTIGDEMQYIGSCFILAAFLMMLSVMVGCASDQLPPNFSINDKVTNDGRFLPNETFILKVNTSPRGDKDPNDVTGDTMFIEFEFKTNGSGEVIGAKETRRIFEAFEETSSTSTELNVSRLIAKDATYAISMKDPAAPSRKYELKVYESNHRFHGRLTSHSGEETIVYGSQWRDKE